VKDGTPKGMAGGDWRSDLWGAGLGGPVEGSGESYNRFPLLLLLFFLHLCFPCVPLDLQIDSMSISSPRALLPNNQARYTITVFGQTE
jgi:hypothetical protein